MMTKGDSLEGLFKSLAGGADSVTKINVQNL